MLSSTQDLIDDARRGRMFILVDDEDRENEGDLVIPAAMATADAINFMARHGRGLICLAMERRAVERLNLPLMAQRHRSRHQTAFTVSIEAREGIATGISAADRARTIQVAIDPRATPDDLVTPGHVFPLIAQDGGALVRAGHTEASVDLARLAGLAPAAVICEIMKDDGTMARLPDLIPFAEAHGLRIGSIADLIHHRRLTERLVVREHSRTVESRHGGRFTLHAYRNAVSGEQHLALVKGEVGGEEPTLVRMHTLDVLSDLVGDLQRGERGSLAAALETIAREGRGVAILIGGPPALEMDPSAPHAADPDRLRHYGIGAQILADLGVRAMTLLTNTGKTLVGLSGHGLSIVGQRRIGGAS